MNLTADKKLPDEAQKNQSLEKRSSIREHIPGMAALSTALIVALFACLCSFWNEAGDLGKSGISAWSIDHTYKPGHLRAYLCALAGLGLLAILPGPIFRLSATRLSPFRNRMALNMVAAAIACFSAYSLIVSFSLPLLVAVASVSLLVYSRAVANLLRFKPVFIAACSCLLLAGVLPGLLYFPPFQGSWEGSLLPSEIYYSLFFLPADRMTYGATLSEVLPNYGILMPLAIAAWQKHVHVLSFGDCITLVRCVQALFTVAMLYLYNRHSRSVPLAGLLATVCLLPIFAPSSSQVYFPNRTAYRYLGFPLSLLLISTMDRMKTRNALLLAGAITSAVLWLNLETGVVCALGISTYLFMRRDKYLPDGWKSLFSAGRFCVAGLALLGCATAYFVFLAFGYVPDLIAYAQWYVEKLCSGNLVASNWHATSIGVLTLFVFAHAAYCMLQTSWASFNGERGQSLSFRAAVSAMILTWLAYDITKDHSWGSVGTCFLYGFLLIDILRVACGPAGRPQRSPLESRVLAVLVVAAIITPYFFTVYAKEWARYTEVLQGAVGVKPVDGSLKTISGVVVPDYLEKDIRVRSQFIKQRSFDTPAMYFTRHTMLVPKVSGILSSSNIDCPHYQLELASSMDALTKRIADSKTVTLYFDSWKTLDDTVYSKSLTSIHDQLIPYFAPTRSECGWDVWTLERERMKMP